VNAHCVYPPLLSADVEIAEHAEGGRESFIAGSAAADRYVILGPLERRVLDLIDGTHTPGAICNELGLPLLELSRFFTKLDEVGILAGERAGRSRLAGISHYWRWSLFNPDALFAGWLPVLRWIWTGAFLAGSLAMIALACLLSILHWDELAHHAAFSLRNEYWGILLAAWVVTATHEFSHGLTSKAFGGRATEVGVLLIYYVFPAFYCNVSGIHMIPQRSRRLWVIAAGLYSQLILGFGALLVWFVFAPDTLPGRVAMAFVLASLLDLAINAYPLLKLDGYYFLSQWLRIPNLMDRSRARWRDVGRRLQGRTARESVRFSPRERRILLVFGYFSFLHNTALPLAILWYASGYLMDWLAFPGLVLDGLVGVGVRGGSGEKSGEILAWQRRRHGYESRIENYFCRKTNMAALHSGGNRGGDAGRLALALDGFGRELRYVGGDPRTRVDHPCTRERFAAGAGSSARPRSCSRGPDRPDG